MTNNFYSFFFTIITICILGIWYTGLFAQTLFKDYTTVGVQSGYSIVTGFYSDSLKNGLYTGIYSFLPINNYFLFNVELAYNRFALEHSQSSSMQIFSINLLPSLFYQLPYNCIIYSGAGASLQYLTLSAMKTNISDSTIKAGLMAIFGIAIPVFNRTLLSAQCVYTLSELSNKHFTTVSFLIKAGYQFAMHSPEYYVAKEKEKDARNEATIQQLFTTGVRYLNKKDADNAFEYFKKVLSLKPNHKESLEYVNAISLARQQYDTAMQLIKHNKDFDALVLLTSASHYMDKAEVTLHQLQKKHVNTVPALINKAIESFNNKNYNDCIATMNVVLLIDPDNSVAKAYIVRTNRIKETILKLQ